MKNAIYILAFVLLTACQNRSSEKPEPTKEQLSTKIEERSFIELGGEKQYVEITGASSGNPVLLFLHGGPGWPQTPHLRYFNADLTKNIILVAWEQSGCGKSYMNDPNPKSLTLEKSISDAHELTQILKKKFHTNKIYLAGFSWGSIIGFHLIQKYPEDYSAYIGITQVINLKKGIQISREWIKQQAKAKNDKETLKVLNQLDTNDTSLCKRPIDCFIKQYEQLSKYHGAIYTDSSEKEIDKAVNMYDDYKNYDWMKGFFTSAYQLEKDLFAVDFSNVKELQIPVYFFMGRHDWNIPTSLTEEFVKNLTAPKKEIVWFENSGHEPLEEEADKFNKEILLRIMK